MRRTNSTVTYVPTEHEEQVAVIRWWRDCCLQYDSLPEELFAIPNAAHRTFAASKHFKDEGLVKGVADLCLAVPSGDGKSPMLWIEMKRRSGGRQSPEQKAFAERVESRGHVYVLARGADQAIAAIEAYLRRDNE